MAADDEVDLVEDAVVHKSWCLCRDVARTFPKCCVSDKQIVSITERSEDVAIAVPSATAPLSKKQFIVAALTDFGVKVAEDDLRVALRELR